MLNDQDDEGEWKRQIYNFPKSNREKVLEIAIIRCQIFVSHNINICCNLCDFVEFHI